MWPRTSMSRCVACVIGSPGGARAPSRPWCCCTAGWIAAKPGNSSSTACRIDWSCVALDWRGFGGSEWAQEGYWFPDYFADLEALLDIVSPGKPARVIAHSMGGNVATDVRRRAAGALRVARQSRRHWPAPRLARRGPRAHRRVAGPAEEPAARAPLPVPPLTGGISGSTQSAHAPGARGVSCARLDEARRAGRQDELRARVRPAPSQREPGDVPARGSRSPAGGGWTRRCCWCSPSSRRCAAG